jgi:hypothetical protein
MKMTKYSGVMIRKEYFEVEVEADDEDQARDLIMDSILENEPYDYAFEFYEGSITEVIKDIEKLDGSMK